MSLNTPDMLHLIQQIQTHWHLTSLHIYRPQFAEVPMVVGFPHQFFQILRRSKVGIDLGEILRPIAVVAIATLPQIGAIEILHHRGDPNAIPAHTTWLE